MAKEFESVNFHRPQFNRELDDFERLLKSTRALAARRDLLPFFRRRKQLSAALGKLVGMDIADRLAFEFDLAGDYCADLVIARKQSVCMIEFEEGAPTGIFARRGRSSREWSRTFERGFSQIVDWFYTLDELKRTNHLFRNFGRRHINFYGLLIVGRSADVSETDRQRLLWRSEKVLVDSHPMRCATYDDVHNAMKDLFELGSY